MPLNPDRVTVIHLARQAARLRQFRLDWSASGWSQFLGEPEVFNAVDGRRRKQIPDRLKQRPAVFGCWASHVRLLEQAFTDDVQCVAVFEDDCVPQPDSGEWLADVLWSLPSDAAGLWLDATRPGPRDRFMRGSFGTARLLTPPLLTHGYVLSRAGIEALLPHVRRFPGHIDHGFAHFGAGLAVYAAVPSLARQADWPDEVVQSWREAFSQSQYSNPVRRERKASSMVYPTR